MIAVDTDGGEVPDPFEHWETRDLIAVMAQHRIAIGSRRNRVEKMCGSGERCDQLCIARFSGKAADLIALGLQPLDIGGGAGSAGNAIAFCRKPPPQRLPRTDAAGAEPANLPPHLCPSFGAARTASSL